MGKPKSWSGYLKSAAINEDIEVTASNRLACESLLRDAAYVVHRKIKKPILDAWVVDHSSDEVGEAMEPKGVMSLKRLERFCKELGRDDVMIKVDGVAYAAKKYRNPSKRLATVMVTKNRAETYCAIGRLYGKVATRWTEIREETGLTNSSLTDALRDLRNLQMIVPFIWEGETHYRVQDIDYSDEERDYVTRVLGTDTDPWEELGYYENNLELPPVSPVSIEDRRGK